MKKFPPAKIHLETIRKLEAKIEGSEVAHPRDIDRLRRALAETPDTHESATSLTRHVRETFVARISGGVTQARILAEMDQMERDFGCNEAPPIERLLIDQVLTARLHVSHAENAFNHCMAQPAPDLEVMSRLDQMLNSAQTRFNRAVNTLARVRHLTRRTPSLQVNIAANGGQQVNVQGHGEAPAPAVNQPDGKERCSDEL